MPKPMKENARSFTIVRDSAGHSAASGGRAGRYVGVSPSVAARHAARVLFGLSKRGGDTVMLALQEITNGSSGKVMFYRVTREKKPAQPKRDAWLKARKIPGVAHVYHVFAMEEAEFNRAVPAAPAA